jgi:hypothetical protein
MRYLIALMAVLALLVNPVAAAAAQVACGASMGVSAQAPSNDQAMAAMPSMAKDVASGNTSANPCCDHSGDGKMDSRTCAQTCATTCAVIVALPTSAHGQVFSYVRAPAPVLRAVWSKPHDPSGLERPPKSIV